MSSHLHAPPSSILFLTSPRSPRRGASGGDNRRFSEITGEIIQKSEVLLGRTLFQTRTWCIYWDIYWHICICVCVSMISEWRRQTKSAGLWQYQTFRHGSIYWTASCAINPFCYFLVFFFFFPVYYGLWVGPHACLNLEWLTEWINCERSLFTPCSWLRRSKNVKSHR